jgi:hypothetical protein
VRPGSTENLIQDQPDPALPELKREEPPVRGVNVLIGLFLVSSIFLVVDIVFSLLPATRGIVSLFWLGEVLVVGSYTLFLREIVEVILLPRWTRWRRHMAAGEEAAHRA